MKRAIWLVLAVCVLSGCPKKKDTTGATPSASASSAAAASAPESSASASASAAATDDSTTSDTPPPPPAHLVTAGAPANPNEGVSHDDHAKTASSEIGKANYKKELDKLEQEDLK